MSHNPLTGYINTKGVFVIEPRYAEAHSFSEGLAKVCLKRTQTFRGENTSRCGYIDRTGRVVIKPEYGRGSGRFIKDRARVQQSGMKSLWGFINREGRLAIPFLYLDTDPFSEGLARVVTGTERSAGIGFIDPDGSMVIEPNFVVALSFSDGLSRVNIGASHEEHRGFINHDGEFVLKLPPTIDGSRSFSEGLAWVMKDRKVGFMNRKGEIVVEPQFKEAEPFRDGCAFVRYSTDYTWRSSDEYSTNNKWGLIDREGKPLFKTRFDSVQPFSEGLAAAKQDSLWGYINREGEYVIEPTFESASPFSDRRARVTRKYPWADDPLTFFINHEGECVIEPGFSWVSTFSEGLAAAQPISDAKSTRSLHLVRNPTKQITETASQRASTGEQCSKQPLSQNDTLFRRLRAWLLKFRVVLTFRSDKGSRAWTTQAHVREEAHKKLQAYCSEKGVPYPVNAGLVWLLMTRNPRAGVIMSDAEMAELWNLIKASGE